MALPVLATPEGAVKRRRVGDGAAVNAVSSALNNADDKEHDYVVEQMRTVPGMTRAIANLIRNGTLKRALEKEAHKAVKKLGRMIPAGTERLCEIHRQVRWVLFWRMVRTQHGISEEFVASDRDVQAKFVFALHCTHDALLPKGHAHEEFEEPLFLTICEEYRLQGERLKNMTCDNMATLGYWSFNSTSNLVESTVTGEVAPTGISADDLAAASDWTVTDACDWDACIASATLGASRKITRMFKFANIDLVPPRDVIPSHPDAVTDELKVIQVPPSVLANRPHRSKAKATVAVVAPKAAAKAPKRPSKPRPTPKA